MKETKKHPSPTESQNTLSQLDGERQDVDIDDGLASKDHGRGAWGFLVGACIVEGVTWGFPASFGVFREYFFTHPPFEGMNVIAVVGVMSNGCLQIIVPFMLQLLGQYPTQRKNMMWTGMVICVASSVGGAFSVTPAQLIISQGTLYGLGSGMLFAPCLSFMSEWFDKRKSLAYGIMCASIGGTGTFLPNVYSIILRKYGHKAMLCGWGIAVGILTTLALFLIQPRLPKERLPAPRATHYRFVRKPLFWLLAVSTVIQGFALNLPGIYLPSYATDNGLTVTKGAVLLSMLNLATAVGQPSTGHLADRLGSIYLPLFLSTTVSGLSCLLIWGFEGYKSSFWALLFVAFTYGSFSGGYAVLRTRFSAAIIGDDEPTPEDQNHQILIVFGVLTALRGFSNAGSGFIGAALVDEGVAVVPGYGTRKWKWLIVFVAVTMLVSAGGVFGKYLEPKRSKKEDNESEANVSGSDDDEGSPSSA